MAKVEFKRPHVPFSANIAGGLAPGREIIVKGKANFYQLRRFWINLGVEPQYRENIALHVGPSMEINGIILTTSRMGNWAPAQPVHNPISFTDRFEFRIKLEQNHFRIILNDRHIGDVQYQFPPQAVNHIDVEGGCELKHVTIEGYPQMQPNYPPPQYAAPVPATPIYTPAPAPTYVQPQPVYVQPYVQTVAVAQPQVVVVEEHHHNRGGGLVAGALMGAAIANRRRRFW